MGSVGFAVGDAIGAVGETVDTLRTGSSIGGSLLVLSGSTVDKTTIVEADLDVVVDQRLAGDVLGLGTTLGSLLVDSVTSVAGVDKGLESGAFTRVGLHDLLVLAETLGQLLVLNVVDEDALSERSWNGSTKLSVTGLATVSYCFPKYLL